MVHYKVTSNNKTLGKSFKKDAKLIATHIQNIEQDILKKFYNTEIKYIDIKILDDFYVHLTNEYINVSVCSIAESTDPNIIQVKVDNELNST